MRLFNYKALDTRGLVVRGQLSAATVEELDLRLNRRGLELIACRRAIGATHAAASRRDLIHFCFQLEQLIAAGVPLLDALVDLRDSLEESPFRQIIATVIERIGDGQPFSAALSGFPAVFDPLFTHLIHAGEESGQLPQVLRDLVEGLQWQDELVSRTQRVLTYPAITAVVIAGVALFLLLYLVPQLARFIEGMQGNVPLHTRALLALSRWLQGWWGVLLAAPLLGGLFALLARRNNEWAAKMDAYKLRLPVAGEILRKIDLARFARLFALMYRAGIPVLDVLRLSAEAVRNRAIRLALARAQQSVNEGERIVRAFEQSRLFPPLVLRMMATGEATGALDTSLANVATFYDREIGERIDRLEAMIGPALTIVLGLLLGWIMLAVLGPLYDLIGKLRL